jgi:hypothetical protein
MKAEKILILGFVFSLLFACYIASVSATESQNLSCVQNALIKREMAIGLAYQNLVTNVAVIFNTRSQSLLIAYGIENKKERNAAIKQAWKDYNNGYKSLVKDFKLVRKSAWDEFNQDRIACKSPKELADNQNNEIRL